MRRFVLDTSVLVHYIRRSPLYQQIETEQRLTEPDCLPIISVVTKAEIQSFAIQHNWGANKLKSLNDLLDKIVTIDIISSDNGLLEAYTQIDAFSKCKFTLKPPSGSAIKMGKNDLWIAATTFVSSAALITTDNDFTHLNGVYFSVIKY